MLRSVSQNSQNFGISPRLVRLALLIVVAGLTFSTMVFPIATRPSSYTMKVGDVSQQDIQAPYALSFTSQVHTEQLREEAVSRVAPVYLPVDPSVARQQIELLRASLNFISVVRGDMYATMEQKLADLAALENIQISREDAEQILALSDARWQQVQQESLVVLEQIMRNTIREGQVKDAQRSIPTLISFTFPQDQALTVTKLITPFIIPNSLYSEEETLAAKEAARQSVQPVTRSFIAGEIIVRRGQIITPSTYEALVEFGLIESPNNPRSLIASGALVVSLAALTGMYFNHRKMEVWDNFRALALIALTFIAFLYLARLVIPNRAVIPYVFPIPAFGLVIACLFNMELGLVLSLVLSIFAAYGLPNGLSLSVFYIVSTLVGILILGKGQRISSFFMAGLGVGAAGSAVILAYRLPDAGMDLFGIITLIGASFFNGVASASLTLLLQFLFAQLLGLATALQLMELSRHDHPLQQFILQNAPGSFQHSLQVAIMAEQAAEKIGADPLLVRVGAIYHDAGKSLNPSFFIENQIPGNINPHNDLDPAVSAQTIIRHVTDGVQLARKYRLPSRVIDFVREHHGTLVTRYQYAKAIEAAGGDPQMVDMEKFRYPGPRPQSRETAILMMADGVQARARAELPADEEGQRQLVRSVIDFCQKEGQLDDTRLTLSDLNTIANSFVTNLKNTYHPRIRYPEIKAASAEVPTIPAAEQNPDGAGKSSQEVESQQQTTEPGSVSR